MIENFNDYEFKEIDENGNEIWVEDLWGDEIVHKRASLELPIKNKAPKIDTKKISIITIIKNQAEKTWNDFYIMATSTKNKFDEEVYRLYNLPAVLAVKKALEKLNWKVTIEPFGRYDIDLMAIDTNGIVKYFEPEVACSWYEWNYEFPRNWFIHVLSRKWHFRDYPNSYLVTVRNDYKRCYKTPFSLLTPEFIYNRKKLIKNYKHPQGEWMVWINWRNESKAHDLEPAD